MTGGRGETLLSASSAPPCEAGVEISRCRSTCRRCRRSCPSSVGRRRTSRRRCCSWSGTRPSRRWRAVGAGAVGGAGALLSEHGPALLLRVGRGVEGLDGQIIQLELVHRSAPRKGWLDLHSTAQCRRALPEQGERRDERRWAGVNPLHGGVGPRRTELAGCKSMAVRSHENPADSAVGGASGAVLKRGSAEGGDLRVQAALGAGGLVGMDDPLARGAVQQRRGLAERGGTRLGVAALRTFLSAVRILERNWRLRSARAALVRILFSADFTFGKADSPTGSAPEGTAFRFCPENRKPESTRARRTCQPRPRLRFDKLPGAL